MSEAKIIAMWITTPLALYLAYRLAKHCGLMGYPRWLTILAGFGLGWLASIPVFL